MDTNCGAGEGTRGQAGEGMTALKPCPFCGGAARMKRAGPDENQYFGVSCPDVHCCGHAFALRRLSEREAAADWNRRAG